MNINRRILLRSLQAFFTSALTLAILYYFANRRFDSFNFRSAIGTVFDGSPGLIAIYAQLILIFFFLRAYRYFILINSIENSGDISPNRLPLLLITMVRGMVVDILPMRLGEVVFISLLKYFCKIKLGNGISIVVVSTGFDLITIVLTLLLLPIFFNSFGFHIIVLLAVAATLVLIAHIVLYRIYPNVRMRLEKSQFISAKFPRKLYTVANDIIIAVRGTLKREIFIKVLLISIFLRLIKTMALYLLFQSVISTSFAQLNLLSNLQALGAVLSSEITGSLPLPNFMQLGLWESGGMAFLSFSEAPLKAIFSALLTVNVQAKLIGYSLSLAALMMLASYYPCRNKAVR